MYRSLTLIAALATSGFLMTGTASADDCNPAVWHFFKADGLSTTRVGAHKLADMCFQAADTNNDGHIDQNEWSNSTNSWFSDLDLDSNDTVDHNEFHQWEPGSE